MKPYLLQFAFDFVGFAIIFACWLFLGDVRYFLTISHFCPICGSTKHKEHYFSSWESPRRKCCVCKKIYWPTTKDQLRRGEVNCAKEDKGRSMRLPEDWREYMAVIFRWKMKKLKERFPRAFKLKVSENKS